LARESATQSESTKGSGFDQRGDVEHMDSRLAEWQKAGDSRLFKLIISPEFGERLDLGALTRGLMAKMEADLGTRLEWIATVHRNTEYPHVHVALRGLTDDGQPLRLPRDHVKHGIRNIAENIATRQLGYRTEMDAQEVYRREIRQPRYTSLDRILHRSKVDSGDTQHDFFVFDLNGRYSRAGKHNLNGRLLFLRTMGLADPVRAGRWHVRCDFDTVLRAMQRTADRQRALASQSVLVSDTRLATRLTDLQSIENLSGRVLGHSEDESTSRSYMILEGADHLIHFIYHSPEIEVMRREAKLRPNSFVQLQKKSDQHTTTIRVEDLGNADALLANKEHLRHAVRSLWSRGATPTESGLSGWLGKYEAAMVQTASELQAQRETMLRMDPAREGGRG
jgi:hypothetical protein